MTMEAARTIHEQKRSLMEQGVPAPVANLWASTRSRFEDVKGDISRYGTAAILSIEDEVRRASVRQHLSGHGIGQAGRDFTEACARYEEVARHMMRVDNLVFDLVGIRPPEV